MNTILALSCQLAILCTYCALVRGAIWDVWLLNDATISCSQQIFQTHYNHQVSLSLSDDDVFYLAADRGNNGHVVYVLNFQIKEFLTWLDDTIFVVTKNESHEVVRLKFAQKREAERFKAFVFKTTPNQVFKMNCFYIIFKIVETNMFGQKLREDITLDPNMPIYFASFATYDEDNNDTGKRRFIIHGGSQNKQFAVFSRNQFNIFRGNAKNRFALVIQSPDGFQESAYYGLALSCENSQHESFETNLAEYASSNINVPEALKTLVNDL